MKRSNHCDPAYHYWAPPRKTENVIVGREMFKLFMTTTNKCYLSAISSNGVVILGGDAFGGNERQRLADQVWQLPGVNQVRDEMGVDLEKTAPAKVIVER